MVRPVYATLLVLYMTTHARSQFFDFFSALQPYGQQTLRPIFPIDITTKRQRTTKTTKRPEATTKRTPFAFYPTTKRPEATTKRNAKNAPLIYDFFGTTVKPSRKTPTRWHSESNPRDTVNSGINRGGKETSSRATNINRTQSNKSKIGNSRNVNVNAFNKSSKPNNSNKNDDRLIFDDGKRNTVINYETTRPSYSLNDSSKKNGYPYTIRPGVRPAVVNGPPITNRPATQRPNFGPRPGGDDDVSPELIIGPSEDYMSTVDKKRHIEMAEKMCDKYKALDIKQIQAIPLVPSPEPVRVNVSACVPHEAPLVVGGRVASIQEFRHMALLGWSKLQSGGYSWKCGGSLVSNQYVLTAAHCAYQDRDNSVVIGPPKAVKLGTSYLDDPDAVVVRVAAVVRHPKYKLPKSYYDIALVKMAETVSFSSVIRPACLGIPPAPGRPIIATGWGKTEFGGSLSQELRSVSLPIWDMTECYSVLGTSRRLPEGPQSDSQICAGEKKGGKDTCQGDSGGPAQIQDGCSWRVVAVTSLGRSCGAAQTPALYAKVPRAFISAVVFGGQSNNNQQSNNQQSNNQQSNNQQSNNQQSNNQQSNNQQSNNQQSNNQQSNNQQSNNQQSNNNQQANKTPQWDTSQWNSQQQPSSQTQNNNQQLNNQQQTNSNQQNWNKNQQENSWTWNRNQGEANKKPEYNNQPQSNNNQWNNNNQHSNTNGQFNNNIKRNDQNNHGYDNQNGHENSNYNQNNNRGQSNNGYTTEKPVYSQQSGYYNGYTTEKPVYNQQSGYNNGYHTEKPVYNQQSGYNHGYTTENPVYNQNSGHYNPYTTEKPAYNSQSGYYSGHDEVVQSGYQAGRGYNDGRVWWT